MSETEIEIFEPRGKGRAPLLANGLTAKQNKFVQVAPKAILGNTPLHEVAAEAGYNGNEVTLTSIATENLRKPLISSRIEAEISRILSPEEVLEGLTEITRMDNSWLAQERALKDKVRSYELLGKYHKLFLDQAQDASLTEADIDRLGAKLLDSMITAAEKKRAEEQKALPASPELFSDVSPVIRETELK